MSLLFLALWGQCFLTETASACLLYVLARPSLTAFTLGHRQRVAIAFSTKPPGAEMGLQTTVDV